MPDILDIIELFPAYSMIQLSSADFLVAGNRDSYRFRLEVQDGVIVNNIEGSAVARDLVDIILSDSRASAFMKGKHIILNLDQNFSLNLRSA